MLAAEKIESKQKKYMDPNFLSVFQKSLPGGVGKGWRIPERDRGHVYTASLAGGKWKEKIACTREKMENLAGEEYVSCDSFFNTARGRKKENLRWIHSLVVDVDVPGGGGKIDRMELCGRIAAAGLPSPSMMVRTPSGGIHAWWFLEPVRATPKAVRLFEALQGSVVAAIGGDIRAVGAGRVWRMPTSESVIFSSRKTHKLSIFRKWRSKNRPEDIPFEKGRESGKIYIIPTGLLGEEAIQKILQEGVRKGSRDDACFSLAVCFFLSGFEEEAVEEVLERWNQKNTPPLDTKEIRKCVASAKKGLKKSQQHYFNAARKRIFQITGEYIAFRHITPPKPREERERSHMNEREEDILFELEKKGGKIFGNQSRLAKS